MRFIVCARDRRSGETTVLGARSYASKDEAISALGGLDSIGLLADDELFLVDLDAATPVVLVPAHRTVAAPDAAADFDPVSVPAVSAPPAPSGFDMTERALGSPIPVEEWPFVEPDDAGAGTVVVGADLTTLDADRSEAWWFEVGIEDETHYDSAEEPAARGENITEKQEVEEAIADINAATASEPVSEASAMSAENEYRPESLFGENEPGGADESSSEPRDPRLDFEQLEAEPETAHIDQAVSQLNESDARVSASDDDVIFAQVDFDAWACTDCIFIATCDRSGSDRPTTCNSFQWRAE